MKELAMYTNVRVNREDAEVIYNAFAASTKPFAEKVALEVSVNLPLLEASFRPADSWKRWFWVRFGCYLPQLPEEFTEMNIGVLGVEIVQRDSTPTRAAAGRYEEAAAGCAAIVESNVVTDRSGKSQLVHNIRVTGPTLEAVQEFHSKLCAGEAGDCLKHTFE